MLRPLPLFAVTVLALAATSVAQVVLPTSAASVGGSSANAFPWGTTSTLYTGMRIMCLYDSSHFTGATPPVTAPILITELKWRANDAATSWTGGTYNNATVRLATAAVDYTLASTNWASNVGPDLTTVYTGPVTVNAGTGAGGGVPGPYHVTITLTTPFLYDPFAGDLVVDTEHVPSNFIGGTIPSCDVHLPGVNASRVFSSTSYPTANGVDANCDVMQIGYLPATGTPATNQVLGQGCIRSNTSFYELFSASSAFDLDNTVLTMIPTAPGTWIVLGGGVGSLLPVGSIATPVVLALANDTEVTRTFTTGSFPGATSFNICSNGYVSIGSNGTSAAPNITTFLNATNTAWRSWHDFNPAMAGSGQVMYEESAAGIVVTWDGVWDNGGTSVASANTMQMQFYPSGQVTFAWGTMSHAGNGHLVGYSPGGNSLNPGNADLTTLAANVLTLGPTDIVPLALAPSSRPILGTNWNLTTSEIPATGFIGVDLFGISDPGVLDLAFLGMPGCQLRSSLEVIAGPWLVGGPTHHYNFAVPATPTSLIGFQLFTQSAVFQVPTVNPFGAITSNGIKGTLGDT